MEGKLSIERHLYLRILLGACLLAVSVNLAECQLDYFGSSLQFRRISEITYNFNTGIAQYQARVVDQIGYDVDGGSCEATSLSYVCLNNAGSDCVALSSLPTIVAPETCIRIIDSSIGLAYRNQMYQVNLGVDFFQRTLFSSGLLEVSSVTEVNDQNPFDVRFNVLNQPPQAAMLPLVTVRFGCASVLEIPIYDSDRFDTVRCECDGACNFRAGITLQSSPCLLNINVSLQVDTLETVSLVIIDTNLNGQDISRVSLQFTLRFVVFSGVPGTSCVLGYSSSSVFPENGGTVGMTVEATFRNDVVYEEIRSSFLPIISPFNGPFQAPSGGQVMVERLTDASFALVVEYDETLYPLPQTVCFQYIDENINEVSSVSCQHFVQARACFSRAAVAGESGETISVSLSITAPFIPEPFNIESSAITANGGLTVLNSGPFSSQSIPEIQLRLDQNVGTSIEASMISIPQVVGPEVLVYTHPAGSTAFVVTVRSIEILGANEDLRVTACRKGDLTIAGIVYFTDTASVGNSVIDTTNLRRFEPFDPFFEIPVGQDCQDFTFPLVTQRLAGLSFFVLEFDAEGPLRVDSASSSIVINLPSRCTTNTCQNGGTCSEINDLCTCPSGFSGTNCEIQTVQIMFQDVTPVTIAEGSAVNRNVCLDPPISQGTITLFSMSVPAEFAADLTFLPVTFIPAGQICTSVQFMAVEDQIPEGTETFVVTLSSTAVNVNENSDMLPITVVDVVDPCSPNPCNGGICSVINNGAFCDCSSTTFVGQFCTFPIEIMFVDATPATINEGTTLDRDICLDPPVARSFDVTFALSPPNADVTYSSLSSIPAGETCTTVTFTAVADQILEGTETFQFLLSSPIVNVDPNSDTLSISVLDVSAVIGFVTTSTAVSENVGTFDVQVCLSNVQSLSSDVAFTLVTTPLSASNYQVPGTGTITAGNTCTAVSISVTDDTIVEPEGHQFTVTITAVTTGNAAVNPNLNTFSVTVIDNDSAVIGFVTSAITVSENVGTFNVQVCLSNVQSLSTDVVFTLVTTPLSVSDYQVPGTGTITAGNTCTMVTISVTDDIIVEPEGHQFTVTITAVTTGNAAINPNFDTFSVTVTDNDNFVNIQFQQNPYTVSPTENDITVTACLDPMVAQPVPISFFALFNGDFEFVTIPVGSLCADITIPIASAVPPITETFDVTVAAVTNGNPGIQPGTTVIVTQNILVAFQIPAATVAENVGFTSVDICLSPATPLINDVTIDLNSVTVDVSEFSLVGQVTIVAGQTCVTLSITVIDDLIFEPTGDQLTVTLMNPTNGVSVDPLGAVFVLTVVDNEAQPDITATLEFLQLSQTEGGLFQFRVCLATSGDVSLIPSPVTVSLAAGFTPGSASSADIGPIQTPIVFSPTVGTNFCSPLQSFTTIPDNLVEGPETFSFAISSISPDNIVIDSPVMLTILDSDDLIVFFNPATYSVMEGDSAMLTVCGSSIINTVNTISLVYNFMGTASLGDVVNIPTTLTIPANTQCGTVSVGTIADNDPQDESFTVAISNVAVGTASGPDALVTIEVPNLIFFNPATYSVMEGDSAMLTVCGSSVISTVNTINLVYSFTGTASPGDVVNIPTTLTIPANTQCGTVSVGTIADNDPQDESFTVSISDAAVGTVSGPDASVTIEVPNLICSFNPATDAVVEGGTFIITVCCSRITNVGNIITLTVNLQPLVVTQDDFITTVENPLTLNVLAGDTCASLGLVTRADGDGDEIFSISITDTTVGTASAAQGTFTILADTTEIPVFLEPLVLSILENDLTASITLRAMSPFTEDIFVSIGVQPITTTMSDFGVAPFIATLPAGELLLPIEIQPVEDGIIEPDEVLEIFIISATGPSSVPEAMATSTITIVDTDTSIISIQKVSPGNIPELIGQTQLLICSEKNLIEPLTVSLDLVSGTAQEFVDFAAVGFPSVQLLPNLGDNQCQPFFVAILDNEQPDLPLEDFTVSIASVNLPGVISSDPAEQSVVCVIQDARDCDPFTSGTEFILTLTPPYDVDDNYLYFISNSPSDVTVTVTISNFYSDTITVPANDDFTLLLPDLTAFPLNPPEIHDNVILVQASGTISLYSQNRRRSGATGESSLIYPYRNLGNYYIVTSTRGPFSSSFVSIASRDPNNQVSITFSTQYFFQGTMYMPSETAVFPLDALRAIYLSSDDLLHGTIIVSSAPLFVLDGVLCNNIPSSNRFCDLTFEQMLPAPGVGTRSVVGPLPSRDTYSVQFTAIEYNTTILFREQTIVLNAGQQITKFVADDDRVYEILSDKPIYIYQFVSSFTADFETGDPAKLVLPAVMDFTGQVAFFVPDISGTAAITIYVRCVERNGLLLDGNAISIFQYYVAEGTEWCSVTVEDLSGGRHEVSHTDSTQTFFVAIFNQRATLQEGSAMAAGFNLGCGDSGCECTAVIDDPCFSSPCMNGGICRRKTGTDGGYFCRCIGNFFGDNCEIDALVCTVSNMVNYVTFDNQEFSIDSNCRYNLLTLPNSATPININIWYNDCDGNVRLDLSLVIGNYEIYFRPGGIVEVNDAVAQFPINIDGISIIWVDGKLVFVSDQGVRLVYDGYGYVLIQVSNMLAGMTSGLCGNSNGIDDEFTAFANFGNGDVIAFANSFLDQSLTQCIQQDPMNPPAATTTCLDPTPFQEICSIIQDATGPFSDCFTVVPPVQYALECTIAVCSEGESVACTYIERYVTACRRENVIIDNWRMDANCGFTCNEGLPVSSVDPCPATCYGLLTDTCECAEGASFEGCQCPRGRYYSKGSCVLPPQCGCVAQGLYFDVGEYYIDDTCTQRCRCMGNNTFACGKFACHPSAVCSTNFQRPACICSDGYVGDGEVCILDTIKGISNIIPCYGQHCHGQCLTSPNYGPGGTYNNWETNLYVVGVPCAMNIRVECDDIDTEDGKDILHIGPGPDVPDLVCVWRYDLPGVLSLSGNTNLQGWDSDDWLLWMYFSTDRTFDDRGWQCCFYADDPCRDDPCANGGICMRTENSGFTCKCPRGFAGERCMDVVYYCGSYGDPHYYTFDGLFYDFQGNCEYYLVDSPTLGLQVSQSLQETLTGSQVTANEVITISFMGFVIELMEGGVTFVDGLAVYLPHNPSPSISIENSGNFVVVSMEVPGFAGYSVVEVWWNGGHFVEICWPDTLQAAANGLCGIPDGSIANDHQSTQGVDIIDDRTFASNFRVDATCFETAAEPVPCTANAVAAAYSSFFCDAAIDLLLTGAFYECGQALPDVANAFKASCLYDGCATLPRQEYVCDTISALEHVCRSSLIQVGSWRTEEICHDSCPPNSFFSQCAPGTTPTCANPDPVSSRVCTAGCVCYEGYLWESGECIPEAQCGCYESGTYYPQGATFLNTMCSTLTICQADGTLFSEPTACSLNEMCGSVDGRPACICQGNLISIGGSMCQANPCDANPCGDGECLLTLNVNTVQFSGCRCFEGLTGDFCNIAQRTCSAFGDPHYVTFDGRHFDFQGRCSYTLVRNGCNTITINPFSIVANNELNAKGSTSTMSITVQYQNNVIVFNRFGYVSINDIFVTLPATVTGGDITRVGNDVVFTTPEFTIHWNGQYSVDITVSASQTDLCGLCGNNDGNPNNDFQTPGGIILTDAVTLGNNWNVDPVACLDPATAPVNPCADVDADTMSRISTLCEGIRTGTGQCNVVIDPTPYFNACVFDGCANPSDASAPFNVMKAYINICVGRQLLDPDWTFPEAVYSELTCPPNSYFAYDAPACEPSCSTLVDSSGPCLNARTCGCRCMEGFVRNGPHCVPVSECGCTDGDRYYPLGEEWLRPGCVEKCQCNLDDSGVAAITCFPHLCSASGFCGVSDGERSCVCNVGFVGNGLSCLASSCLPTNPCSNGGTCQALPFGRFRCVCPPGTFGETCTEDGALCYIYGDPYFETFDGLRYDFQGACEYSIVRACGTSSIPFTISGTLEAYPDSPQLSALSSVTITLTQPRTLTFVLDRNGVWRNGDPVMDLPFYSLSDNVEIIYSGNDIWFRSNYFNLKWDQYSSALVEMRSDFLSSGLCGLCGNYDGDPNNDFSNTIGVQVGNVETFGDSFRLMACPQAVAAPDDPCALNTDNAALADQYCAIILDSFGPFTSCPLNLRTQADEECRRDVCLAGQGDKICSILEALTHRCLVVIGGPPIDWRLDSPFPCPVSCPPDSLYSNCVDACRPTCGSIMNLNSFECNYPCVPGCQCRFLGDVFQNGQCIPPVQCGCYDSNGNYYRLGESYLTGGCSMQCTCTASGIPECVDFSCPMNSQCAPSDGVEQCACQDGFIGDGIICEEDPCSSRDCGMGTCVSVEMLTFCICPPGTSGESCELELSSCYSFGDPHFYTFDGQIFDYHGGCKYLMVRSPIGGIQGSELFNIFQVNEKLQIDDRISTIVGVTATFPSVAPGMEISIGRNGAVSDNAGIIHTLPWEFHPDVLVETNGIAVFIKTTFGVEVEWHYLEQVVKISLTSDYQGQTEGLCGNFNGILQDDIPAVTTPGQVAATSFGNSWVDNTFICAVSPLEPSMTAQPQACDPASTDAAVEVDASSRCNVLLAGNLVNCQLTQTALAVVQCRFDVCAKQSAARSECSAYAFAAFSCEEAAVDSGFWRQGRCEVTCPDISVYSPSASACPRTCFDLLRQDDSPCREANREACVCPDGYYWSGDECVLPENCGCIQDGQYFKLNEVLYNDACTERCVCGGPDVGFVCSPSICDANANCVIGANGRSQCVCVDGFDSNGITCTFNSTCPDGCGTGVCGDQNGRPGCICPEPLYGPTCALTRGACRSFGDPHYITFDGLRYDFQGECSYIAVTTAIEPTFTVTQRNEPVGSNGASTAEAIFIELNPGEANEEVIALNRGRVVTIDGSVVEPPFSGTRYNIVDAGGHVRFISDFGLEVEWNGINEVTYYLDDRFANSNNLLQGLCGNFNGNPNDDVGANFGVPLFDFAVGFANRPFDPEVCEGTRDMDPCGGNAVTQARAEEICGIISSANGPFATCGQALSAAEWQFYSDSCVYDTCLGLRDSDNSKICDIISVFARRCQGLGFNVNGWRSSLDTEIICVPQCPSGSTFSDCTSTCPVTCGDTIVALDPTQTPSCSSPCQEGCECAEGLVWQGGICIPAAQCGCFDPLTMQFYTPGRIYLRPGCQEECTCMPGGTLDCTPAVNCHCEAVCQQVGGAFQCVCPPPFIGDGIICTVDPCMLERPCTAPAVCQPVATGGTICECPPGQFGNDCSLGSSMCFAVGGEFYVSYDGQTDLFYGSQCTYTLTATCDPNREDAFSVQITLADDTGIPFARGNDIASITVTSRAQTVTVTRIGPPDSFTINGEEYEIITLGNLDIVAWRLLDRVIVFLRDGVLISFTQGTVSVTTSEAYFSQLCGICGDYDGNALDATQLDFEIVSAGVCVPDDNTITPCTTLDAVALATIQTECMTIAEAYPGCQLTDLQNQCVAAGCANYPDVSAVCSFVDVANSKCGTAVQDINNFGFCRQDCGDFAQFTNAIDGCVRTCNSPFPLPFCPVPSMSGCQCEPGRILNDVGACVLPAQCGCLQSGVYYEPGQNYYTPNCAQLCTCQLGGFPTCVSTNGCPTLATCEMTQPSVFECQCIAGFRLDNFEICVADPCENDPCQNGATCSPLQSGGFECCCLPGFEGVMCERVLAECKIYGNTVIDTFDGLRYHFIGGGDTCEYELASGISCAGDSSSLTVQDFRLTGSFRRGSSITTAVLSSITFTATNYPEIRIVEGGILLMDGVQVFAPVTVNDLLITSVFDTFILRFDFGLNVVWREGYAYIYLDTDYSQNTCGLCGNMDGVPNNDARMRGSLTTTTPTTFANSFLVSGTCFGAAPVTGTDLCVTRLPETVTLAETFCAALISATGPFSECVAADTAKAQSFYDTCRNDLCESLPVRRTLCSTYEAFAHWCRNANFPVRDWRGLLDQLDAGSSPCPFNCPMGSTYTNQMITCPPSCGLDSNIDRKRDCLVGFLEGCRCDAGLVVENDRCIQPEACGCLYENSYMPVGDTILNSACDQTITCPANNNGIFSTETFTCPLNGECIVQSFQQVCQCSVDSILSGGVCIDNPCLPDPCNGNGICRLGTTVPFYCICNPEFAGRSCDIPARQCFVYGDPNFLAFDFESFEFQASGCEYNLVTNTGRSSSITITTETDPTFTRLTRVSSINILEPGVDIALQLDKQLVTVCVGGVGVIPPLTVRNSFTGEIAGQLYSSGVDGYVTFVSESIGYEVRVTGNGAVTVKYPITTNVLGGLCGNADGVSSISTANQQQVNAFGDAQRVPGCTAPATTATTPDCTPVDDGVCELINPANPDSPFINCFNLIQTAVFYTDCRKDLCVSNQGASYACAVIATYAQLCRDYDITIGNWRLNTDCARSCPSPNSFFDSRAPANPPTCAEPNPDQSINPLPDVEGCVCAAGFLFEQLSCIPASDCGCDFNGVYFPRGSTYISDDCSTQCVCPPTGTFNSNVDCETGLSCHPDAICTIQDKARSCQCNVGFEGDGLDCFLPGCGGSPCQNGGTCLTRPIPDQPDNPGFFCECAFGFVGETCSISSNLLVQGLTQGPGSFTSPSFPGLYNAFDRRFRQFFCSGSTYLRVDITAFITETDVDFLFFGTGFPTTDPTTLVNSLPPPNGVEVLTGLREFAFFEVATDSIWFYFDTDSNIEFSGFNLDVTCFFGDVPVGVVGHCFTGALYFSSQLSPVYIPNGRAFPITDCETCVCNNGELGCTITDVNSHTAALNTLPQAAQESAAVRGQACTDDSACSALPGSRCVFPTCLTGPCPASQTRVCSSGDTLRLCSVDSLCRSRIIVLNSALFSSEVFDLEGFCSNFLAAVAPLESFNCFVVECQYVPPQGRKRSVDDSVEVEIHIGARSSLKSDSRLSSELDKFEKDLDENWQTILEPLPYVVGFGDFNATRIVNSDGKTPIVVTDTETGSLWTYLLAILAVVLLLVAVGLGMTIVSYYRRQKKSFNAKFNPAEPSYPTDNLPESLEMVRAKDRKNAFATRIPLDDSTGNKDNVFVMGWHRESQKNGNNSHNRKPQSDC